MNMNTATYMHPKTRSAILVEKMRKHEFTREESAYAYGYLQSNSDCWDKVRRERGLSPSPRTGKQLSYAEPSRRAKRFKAELMGAGLTASQIKYREGYVQSYYDNFCLDKANAEEIEQKQKLSIMREYSADDLVAIYKNTADFSGADL